MTSLLIVDDNEQNLYMLQVLLKGNGYDVVSAANGAEALEKARRHPPDMIVTDILMPVMDGFTLCRQWKGDDRLKGIPFVFYTATYTDPKDEELALSLGAERFIVKPAEPDVFVEMLREVLENHEAGRLVVPREPVEVEEEAVYYREYNEVLIHKLEDKMLQLEEANRTLELEMAKRKQSEERIAHLNAVLRAIRSVNQLIVRERDRERLLQGVCDNLVETRSYYNAWTALFDEAGGLVMTAETGLGEDFQHMVHQLKGGKLPSCGPKALGQSSVVVVKDPPLTCADCSLSAKYSGRGEMSIRLEHEGTVYGLLVVSMSAHFVPDEEEQKLIEEVAGDISFALHSIELEEEIRGLAKFPSENPNPVLRVAKDGAIIYANEASLPLLSSWGCQEGQPLPHDWCQFTLGVLCSGSNEEIEVEVGNRMFSLTFAPVVDAGYVNVYGLDITKRKRAEEALRESEEHFRSLVTGASDVITMTDLEGNILFINEAGKTLHGVDDLNALIGRNAFSLIAEESLECAREGMEIVLRKGVAKNREYVLVGGDGKKVSVEMTVSVIRDVGGKPFRFMAITRDITERKQAEEELRQSYTKLQRALEGTVNVLAATIEMRDPYTAGHQRRTTQLACAIARDMGLLDEQIEGLRMAGLIHDLGKISIPAEVLSNPNPLSDFQWNLIKAHPRIGYDILKTVEFPWPVAEVVLQHHERLDGSGYPQGLSSRDILMKAKILAVADVVEAMASFRPYRPARGIDEALEEISRNKGILYDAEVVDVCLKLFTEKGFEFE